MHGPGKLLRLSSVGFRGEERPEGLFSEGGLLVEVAGVVRRELILNLCSYIRPNKC